MRKLNGVLVIGLIMFMILVFMSLFPGLIAPGDPHETSSFRRHPVTGGWQSPPFEPGPGNLLGSDRLGRDIYTRIIWGTQFTLVMAVSIASCRFAIAFIIGLLASWRGGIWSWLVKQIVVISSGLPLLLVAYVFLETYRLARPARAEAPLAFAIILIVLGWPRLAAQIHTIIEDAKKLPFVEPAYAAGACHLRILWRHLLPSVRGHLLAAFAIEITFALVIMGQLGLIGLFPGGPVIVETVHGVEEFERLPEWGQMLAQGRWGAG